ncbi:MAG: methyl-accepting chemotaxis protein [Bacillota bacterium]
MNWFSSLKIGVRLILSFCVVAFIAAVIGLIGTYNLNNIAKSANLMWHNNALPIAKLEDVLQRYQHVRLTTLKLVMENDRNKIQKFIDDISEDSKAISEEIDYCSKIISTEEEKTLYKNALEARNAYRVYLKTVEELGMENKDEEARIVLLGDMTKAAVNYEKAIGAWVKYNIEAGNATADKNSDSADSAIKTMFLFMLIGVGASVGFGIFISNMIKRPVNKVLLMAQELQKGHVNARAHVESNDEIGIMAKTLDQFAVQLEGLADGMLAVSKGDVSLELPSYDTMDRLSPSMNAITKTLRNLTSEVIELTRAAVEGQLSKRGNTEKYEGGFKQIVKGFNDTLDTIMKNIRDYEVVVEKVGRGDLTARMIGEYKGDYRLLQQNANNFAESLNQLILQVHEATQATASSASEISSSSEQMAAGSQEQSQQTTEVVSAVEEMTKTILESTQNAAKASENSRLASESATEGQKKVEDTKRGMLKIVQSTKSTGEKITSLAKKTEQIGEIAQVIDDIADQTNLLALNAAIEAARAGEQGRGFAVVADEVRKLAERTTKATKEIADTIRQIQSEAKEADQSMNEANKVVEEGMNLTEAVALSLSQILEINQRVSDIVSQVAAASEEQSSAAEQISKNIEGISSVTQQSAAGTEQIAKAAEDLNRLTVNLQELVSRFRLSNENSGQFSQASRMISENKRKLIH